MPVINTVVTVSFQVRNATTGAPVTGDESNLTLWIVADGINALPSNSPVEIGLGEYNLTLTGAENKGELMAIIGTSTTAGAIVIPSRWANLDAAISSRATLDAITAMMLPTNQKVAALDGRITDVRAAYLDAAISSRATAGSLAAIIATVSLTGGAEVDGNEVTLIRGDNTPLYLAMKNETDSPIDLTAYAAGTFTLTVKPQRNRDDTDDANMIFDATGTITDAASGIVSFSIGAADTELLSRGECYDFDVQYDSGDGATVKTFMIGEIKLQYDVTRTSSA